MLVLCFVGVIVGGTAAWWGFPPVALAAGQCNNYLKTDAGRSSAGDFQDLGVRASGEDLVYGGGVQCAHADTVSVLLPNQDSFVEAGWATMQSAYSAQDEFPYCNSYLNSPHAFYVYRQNHAYTCNVYSSTDVSVSGGDKPTTSVYSDQAHPGTWILDFSNGSGGSFTHAVSGWTYTVGAGLTNCDRHYLDPSDNTKESCQAHFTGMQYRTSPPGWQAWGSELCANGVKGSPPLPDLSNDPTYNNQLTQPNEVLVSAALGQC